MNPDELIELLRAQPFEPFEVHLTNGSIFHVNHPDQAMVVPIGETLYVLAGERAQRIACMNIANVSTNAMN